MYVCVCILGTAENLQAVVSAGSLPLLSKGIFIIMMSISDKSWTLAIIMPIIQLSDYRSVMSVNFNLFV